MTPVLNITTDSPKLRQQLRAVLSNSKDNENTLVIAAANGKIQINIINFTRASHSAPQHMTTKRSDITPERSK